MERNLFNDPTGRAAKLLTIEGELRRLTADLITAPIEDYEQLACLLKAVNKTKVALTLLCRAVGYTSDESELRDRHFNKVADKVEHLEHELQQT